MKKTLFIIKEQGSEDFPSFYSKLGENDQSYFLFLQQSSHSKWSFIHVPMVLNDSIESQTPSGKIKQVTYQDMLEKIFEFDVALVL